ncbi:hypothetical protein MTDSW087_00924 [Methylobacterium dankookense]|uniref:Uncharacterized protein n=1 Tax=Methylobacterium dankookense TaxID=560405 RepID=A0A564FTA3_9HYPH|nr:hypothetical protein IFDJLNFL_3358 [Methylobacterium dankookense]VUF11247.1 hypothetical protein MTDSW087_00924 [Methylobacterium dankookense]
MPCLALYIFMLVRFCSCPGPARVINHLVQRLLKDRRPGHFSIA